MPEAELEKTLEPQEKAIEGVKILEYTTNVRLKTNNKEINLLGRNGEVSFEAAYLSGLIDERHRKSVRGLREKIEGRETLKQKGLLNENGELNIELSEKEKEAVLAASKAYIKDVKDRLREKWCLKSKETKEKKYTTVEEEIGQEVAEYLSQIDKNYVLSRNISRNTSANPQQAGLLMRRWREKHGLDKERFAAFYSGGTQWNLRYLKEEEVLEEFLD